MTAAFGWSLYKSGLPLPHRLESPLAISQQDLETARRAIRVDDNYRRIQ
jgi:hypothetical protein